MVAEGVASHDDRKFAAAISKYDQALQIDQDNLNALAEKVMALSLLQKYEDAMQALLYWS